MTAALAVRKTVLVVEHNQVDREGLAVILRREGYGVLTAADGQQALDQLRASPPQLILLDATLPDGGTGDFLSQRADDAALSAIPVILTADTVGGGQYAQALGAAGFLHRPFDQDEVLAEVRRHLA